MPAVDGYHSRRSSDKSAGNGNCFVSGAGFHFHQIRELASDTFTGFGHVEAKIPGQGGSIHLVHIFAPCLLEKAFEDIPRNRSGIAFIDLAAVIDSDVLAPFWRNLSQ